MDWGFNAPGCVLFWACLPDGHYHIGAEYKFQYTPAETVADEIKKRVKALGLKRGLRYIACDPSMKARTGHGRGESILETLQRKGLNMRPSDNDRLNGWMRVHELLQRDVEGKPWLTVEPTCKYLVRSIPAQQSDRLNPDDLDTHGDDHAVDALRYGAMSRPSPTRLAKRTKRLHPLLEEALAASRTRTVLGADAVRKPHAA